MVTDLLFYDPAASTGEFYMTEGGGIELRQTAMNWRQSWTQVVPGKFGGTGLTDLLFYDPTTGTGEFYTVDGYGGMRLLQQYTGWRTSWTQIVPGSFMRATASHSPHGLDLTDLLFYDAAAGVGEFYACTGP